MNNKIMKTGDIYRVASEEAVKTFDRLPAQNYVVKFDDLSSSFFLEVSEPFQIPKKLYGNTERMADRILNTFEQRSSVTGVLLEGDKGSGKTLLAKYVSVLAAEYGMPTILVNQAFHGDVFNQFIQALGDNVVIIMDEFEKVYPQEHQEKVLTLLDGVFPSKKLFFLTINNMHRFNDHMINRPGRVYYNLSYKTLSSEFIKEYCEDNLDNKDNIESIVTYAKIFSSFNFDMLQASVEEMNRYGETFDEVLEVLNVIPGSGDFGTFNVSFTVDGCGPVIFKNEMSLDIRNPEIYVEVDDINFNETTDRLAASIEECSSIHIGGQHIVDADIDNETYVYETTCNGMPVVCTIKRNDPYVSTPNPVNALLGISSSRGFSSKGKSDVESPISTLNFLNELSY